MYRKPQGSKDPNDRVLGPNTVICMLFGPQNPNCLVPGPLGKYIRIVDPGVQLEAGA